MDYDLSDLRPPWVALDDGGEGFVNELEREVSAKHVLHGKPLEAIGRREDRDDVLFHYDEGFAVVHLTYAGRETDPQFPWTNLYVSWSQFVNDRLEADVKDYEQS